MSTVVAISSPPQPDVFRLGCGQRPRIAMLLSLAIWCSAIAFASGQTLRVVSYNIDADTGGADGQSGGVYSGPGLTTVLQAIGNVHLGSALNSQPIDVLALQELHLSRTTTTLGFVVDQLNGVYGPGTYAYDTTFDPTTGGTGGGPNGLVYNTKTVQLLGAAAVGSASSAGAPRAPMRYTLAPKGFNDHSADFTIYVSHMKAGSVGTGTGSNGDRRNIEATTIRNDGATLGASAHIIYSGDYNLSSNTEAAYRTMISSTLNDGVGKAVDTLNPNNNWTTASSFRSLFTESAPSVSARFDFQFVTAPMIDQPGMQLIAGTLGPFGHNGSISKGSSVTSSSNTALGDLDDAPYTAAYRTGVLQALTTATDHLPVVADYSFASAIGAPGDFDHSGLVDLADYTLWQSTFGSTTKLFADGNRNGVVDTADYAIWRRFATPATSSLAPSAVPEPHTFTVFALLGVCLCFRRPTKLKG